MKILVLEVPALHLGFLGCYGNDWTATPNLDRLAAEGIVFDRHLADTFVSPGNEANLHAWLQPLGIGVHRFTLTRPTKPFEEIVAKVRLEGPQLVWVEWPSLAPPWDLSGDVLDLYCEDEEEPWANPLGATLAPENDDARLQVQDTYAAVATFVDAEIGRLRERLEAEGLLDRLAVVVTACEGLSLGEHGPVGPRTSLHEEVVHLPWVMRLPEQREAGLRIDALTQPADLLPTLLDLCGMPVPTGPGRSVLPWLAGPVEGWRTHALTRLDVDGQMLVAVRTAEWALVLAGKNVRLFAKPEDRWEVNDVQQPQPEALERLINLATDGTRIEHG